MIVCLPELSFLKYSVEATSPLRIRSTSISAAGSHCSDSILTCGHSPGLKFFKNKIYSCKSKPFYAK